MSSRVRSSGRTQSAATLAAGGARSGKKGIRWASLVEESSESEVEVTPVVQTGPRPLPSLADDPLFIAMSQEGVLWGDVCLGEEELKRNVEAFRALGPVALAKKEPVPEEAIWAEPWAARLEMNGGADYDTSCLTDADWAVCMTWLYANGWYIWAESRQGFSAVPDTLPPRVWVPPRPAAAASCCQHKKEKVAPGPLSAPGTDTGRRRAPVRPIFCNGGDKCTEGCPYVHGDTIPVLNSLCQFGDSCSKRVVALGATPCCRLHPDEGPWNASMVRHRPVA